MEFRVLGPLEVVRDGRGVPVRGSRRRLLLATLLVHRNHVVSVDRLVEVLFGDDPPARGIGTVQSYVSRLRHDLGGSAAGLQTRPGGYLLAVDSDDLDAVRFERRVSEAGAALASDAVRAADLVTEALGWWRGPAFAEFTDDLSLSAERTRLDEVRQRAFEVLVDARSALGDHVGAIDLLERCIADWPLRERFRAQHMLALYRCGRHPEALRAYRRFRDELGNELGLEPSPALALLEAQILRHDASLDSSAAEAPGTPPMQPTAVETPLPHMKVPLPLPLPLTTFVGRESELADLTAVLESARVLTLIGSGGVGKTRLAMRLAEVSAGNYPDGVWVCDLATIRDPALATDAITTALDVQRRQDRSALESLVEVLQARHLLVVFDSCEHLLAPIGEVTETLLRRCPGVRILATSREPLTVDGETVRVVHPLPVPEASETDPIWSMRSPAVGLFVDRAIAAHPGFRLTPAAVPAVVEICRRLDGVPLAIELAAARVRSMAVADVAAGLDERFTLLTAGRRTEPRHQTLLAAVEWSHDLLDRTEQTVFRRLAVFAGTFTLDDVERVCTDDSVSPADARAVVPALVDKSMVVADTAASPTRYSLLETLRAFGHQRLAREDVDRELERRHAEYFVERVVSAGAELGGPDEGRWADLLDDAFDDLRVAHRWATVHGDIDAALRLVAGAHEFAFRRMRYELFTWAEASLESLGDDEHPLGPVVLAIAAYGRFVRGDLEQAMAMAEQSLTLEQRLGLAPSGLHWRTMGNVFYYRGRSAEAAAACHRMVRAARTSRDDARLVHALYMTAVGLASAGRSEESRSLAEEALSLAHRIHNPTALASALYARAITLEPLDPGRAASMLEQAVEHGTSVGNRWIVAFARTELISLAARRGDLDRALELAGVVIDTWYRAGDWANQWLTLRHVAGAFALHGEHEVAAVLRGALHVASADLAMPIEASDLRRLAAILERLPDALGPVRLADLEARGAALSGDDVVHYAQDALAVTRP
ncbi:MAG: BTAD domain-containing putative transcriptional regulator [Acidimicrobiia bacterium]